LIPAAPALDHLFDARGYDSVPEEMKGLAHAEAHDPSIQDVRAAPLR
jgi:hypothetical protein